MELANEIIQRMMIRGGTAATIHCFKSTRVRSLAVSPLTSYLHSSGRTNFIGTIRNSHFEASHLGRCEANYAPLTPLSSFERTVSLYSSSMCYVYGSIERTWGDVNKRVSQFASALVYKGTVWLLYLKDCSYTCFPDVHPPKRN